MFEIFRKNKVGNYERELIDEYIKLRYESGITQRDLAKKTKLAQSTIARFEKNLHSASLRNFIKLLDAIGYKLEINKKEERK